MRNNNYLSLINFKVKTLSSETFFFNSDHRKDVLKLVAKSPFSKDASRTI